MGSFYQLRIFVLVALVILAQLSCYSAFIQLGNVGEFYDQHIRAQQADQTPFSRISRSRIERRDRPCLINAGLSQGCDFSDILYAKYQANKFSSFAGPGKR